MIYEERLREVFLFRLDKKRWLRRNWLQSKERDLEMARLCSDK